MELYWSSYYYDILTCKNIKTETTANLRSSLIVVVSIRLEAVADAKSEGSEMNAVDIAVVVFGEEEVSHGAIVE